MNKIISLLAVFSLFISSAFAQAPTLKIAPEVGATFGIMSQKYDGGVRETLYQPGFQLGAVLDIAFSEHFSLQPGIFFLANNGTESKYHNNYATGGGMPASITDHRQYHINYFQIPVYALYKVGDKYTGHLFVGAGPYFGIAVGGRYQQDFTNTLNGQSIVKRYDYPIHIGYGETDEIGRYDMGLRATIGFETTFGLYLRVYYGYGLLNISPITDSKNQYHQSGGGLSIGYFFQLNNKRKY